MELNIKSLILKKHKNKAALKLIILKLKLVINNDKPIEYRKDFMKIKFESDDDLNLHKAFNILDMIIAAASVLEKNGKYYPQTFLHECAYKL